MTDRLTEIEQRAAKATPGKWFVEPHHAPCTDGVNPVPGYDVNGPDYVGDMECNAMRKHDADFVAGCRSDIPWLVANIRWAIAYCDRMLGDDPNNQQLQEVKRILTGESDGSD